MKALLSAIVCTLLAACLLSACGGPPPPPIEGDRVESGLVILDVSFELRPPGMRPEISREAGETIGAILLRHDDKTELRGCVVGHRFVLFEDVPPGRYTAVAAMGRRGFERDEVLGVYDCSGDFSTCPWGVEVDLIIPPESRQELTFNVEPGELAFGGRLYFDEWHDSPFHNVRTSLLGDHLVDYHRHSTDRSPPKTASGIGAEYNVLNDLFATEKLGKGYWETVIRRRYAELKKIRDAQEESRGFEAR